MSLRHRSSSAGMQSTLVRLQPWLGSTPPTIRLRKSTSVQHRKCVECCVIVRLHQFRRDHSLDTPHQLPSARGRENDRNQQSQRTCRANCEKCEANWCCRRNVLRKVHQSKRESSQLITSSVDEFLSGVTLLTNAAVPELLTVDSIWLRRQQQMETSSASGACP